MMVDLHAHYPMHLAYEGEAFPKKPRNRTLEAIRQLRKGRHGFGEWLDAFILDIASRIANYSSWDAGPAVTVDNLVQGGVNVALSVLYQPFDEMDLEHFEEAPKAAYFVRSSWSDRERRARNQRKACSARDGCAQ